MEAAKRAGAVVDPKVHALLAAPRAAARQSALESLAALDPSVLVDHGPAIAARLDDKQKGVRHAALVALKRLPVDSLFEYAPAIMERLEDNDNDVREAAQDLLEVLDSASVLPPSTALQMRRLEDSDPSVRSVAVQALSKEPIVLERLAPGLVKNLGISRFHVRLGALEALGALSPFALAAHKAAVAACLDDSHQAVRLAALRTLAHLEPDELDEVADLVAKLIDAADPFLSEGALTTLTQLHPAALGRYAEQIGCCRFDEEADVRQAAALAIAKMRDEAGATASEALSASTDAAAAWSETPD